MPFCDGIGAYDREGGEKGVEKLLELADRPTAIFATNHLVAASAILAAQRRGLTVPADLSVISFYNGPVAELINPAVTAVRFPLERLGYESVGMLVKIIEDITPSTTSVVIPHDGIIVRQSTTKVPARIKKAS